jgi:glycosyltransferase involved in cell wall biosynthesis
VNLLLFNLTVDEKHVTLAFGLRWIEELACRFDHVDVVTMHKGQYHLPANVKVWSVGRERGYSELRRFFRFYFIVWRILRQRQIDVVFTHMIHVFVILFWPLGKIFGIRNVLWYAHGATPIGLRLAHMAADRVVSSTPEGFRLRSKKVKFLGQGVDTALFGSGRRTNASVFRVLSVGRIAPVKGLEILLDVMNYWHTPDGRPWELQIVGAATSESERAYEAEMIHKAELLQKIGRVVLSGRLNPAEIAELLKQADVFINLSRTGSLDKAIVEALATGCPVISCNEAFRALAEEGGCNNFSISCNAGELASALTRVACMSSLERADLERRLRDLVVKNHSLDGLIERLHTVLISMISKKTIVA